MKTKNLTSKFKSFIITMLLVLGMAKLSGAQNWTQINSGTTKKINTICFSSPSIGYLGGNDSLLMKTTDGGASWSQINFSGINFALGGAHILNLQFLNDNVGFMTVGPYSGSYGTSDGGLTWNLINLAGNHCYNQGLYFFDENNGFIGGSGCFQGEIISSIVNQNWLTGTWNAQVLNSPLNISTNYITDIDFYDNNYGLAVSKSGYVFKTSNGGVSWDSIATPAPLVELTSVLIVNDTLAYAGYNSGNNGFGLYVSNDAGLTWSYDMNSATFFYPNFLTLHKTGNGSIYTAGNSQIGPGVIFSNIGGFSFWNANAVDQSINDVASYNDSIVFAVGDSGYIVVNHPQAITGRNTVFDSNINFDVFPNPASSTLNFAGKWLNSEKVITVNIYSTLGQFVKSENVTDFVDISNLKPGIYYVELITAQQSFKKKFIKQ
jgi:photosystem II stability/assembly factor-like uncharacterized protein